jgi:phage shock protein C
MNRRLYRSRRDRMIGGVAAGLSDYFDIDPTLVRVLFVVALFLGGSSILAYIILWIVVPEEPIIFPSSGEESKSDTSTEEKSGAFDNTPYTAAAENQSQKRRIAVGVILIVIGLLFLVDNFIPRIHFGDFWPLVLIGIGLALLLNSKRENNIL